MKRRNYIISLVIVILLAIVSTIGSSYALWVYNANQAQTNKLSTGCFEFGMAGSGGFDDSRGSSINLTNTYPIRDEKGLSTSPYIVVLQNSCADAGVQYELVLSTKGEKSLIDDYLKVNLVGTENKIPSTTEPNPPVTSILDITSLLPTFTTVSVDQSVVNEVNLKDSTPGQMTSYLLAEGVIAPQTEVRYDLRLWLDITAPNETMNQTFIGVVSNRATPVSLIE